jgi:hypothetical protein
MVWEVGMRNDFGFRYFCDIRSPDFGFITAFSLNHHNLIKFFCLNAVNECDHLH